MRKRKHPSEATRPADPPQPPPVAPRAAAGSLAGARPSQPTKRAPSPPERAEGPKCPIDRTPSVREVVRDARRLVSLGEQSDIWEGPLGTAPELDGAIVRLRAPAGATPARVEEAVAECRALGAVAVKVVGASPVLPPSPRSVEVQQRPERSVLEVVRVLVGEGRPELWGVVEEALEVGQREAPPAVIPSSGEQLWVSRVELRNWFRYRGEHVLELEPKVYGVTATTEADPERSNWQGKSSLLNAVAFALYGWLPEYVRGADDWITRGESEGRVSVVLSDGSAIDRWRKRGKSTQVVASEGSNLKQGMSSQASAQDLINRLVGLSEADFFATCFFEQRAIAKFVRARPGDRLEVVRGWLDLQPLVAAEGWARAKLAAAVDLEKSIVAESKRWQDLTSSRLQDLGVPDEVRESRDSVDVWIRHQEADLEQAVAVSRDEAREGERLAARAKSLVEDRAVLERYESLESQRRGLSSRLQGMQQRLAEARESVTLLRDVEQASRADLTRAQDEHRQKCELARGEFDGRCPVAGIDCPVKDKINGDRKKSRQLVKEAEKNLARAEGDYRKQKMLLDGALRVLDEGRDLQQGVAELTSRIDALAPTVERVKRVGAAEGGAAQPDVDELWSQVSLLEAHLRNCQEGRGLIAQGWRELDRLVGERKVVAANVALLREVVALLGPGGAQKEVAVAELERIQALANETLRRSGVDLSVAVRWGRESSSQLAPTCDECGRVGITGSAKNCPACGKPRRPKVQEKLDVDLSDRSGAAEDLAGLELQLAASAWLRERRGARLSVTFVDEPFGALDPAHARGLSAQLAGILSGGGSRQAFVIAHSPSAMDALPGRIRVTGHRDGSSKVEVLGG